jgi:hypothetical protein
MPLLAGYRGICPPLGLLIFLMFTMNEQLRLFYFRLVSCIWGSSCKSHFAELQYEGDIIFSGPLTGVTQDTSNRLLGSPSQEISCDYQDQPYVEHQR